VEQSANPATASFGLVSGIKNPNMSQKVPDCAPPPAPQPSCACGGYPGTVSWSGWDQVTGGTCNGGGAGGWLTTPGGCYACPPPPPPAPQSAEPLSSFTVNFIQNGQSGVLSYTGLSNGQIIETDSLTGTTTTIDGSVNNGQVTGVNPVTGNILTLGNSTLTVAYGNSGYVTTDNSSTNTSSTTCSSDCNGDGSTFDAISFGGGGGINPVNSYGQ